MPTDVLATNPNGISTGLTGEANSALFSGILQPISLLGWKRPARLIVSNRALTYLRSTIDPPSHFASRALGRTRREISFGRSIVATYCLGDISSRSDLARETIAYLITSCCLPG